MKKEERKHLEQIMRRDIMYIQGVQMEEAVEIVRHCFFRDEEMQVMEYEIHSPEEFRDAYMKFIPYWNFERCINELHENTGKESFYYYGKCAVCNSPQPLLVDYQNAEHENGRRKINWRERLICPNCGCNSRQRFVFHKILENYVQGDQILLYEQNTEIYRSAVRDIKTVTGFEYTGVGNKESEIAGISCEDICELSFGDQAFSMVVANDVFELTPEYQKAFSEAYRVLQPGGKLIFTVPFDGNSLETVVRAEMGDNGLVATTEEWYYESAIPGVGPMIVCQIFGWDILETLRQCGFNDVCGKVYYGLSDGYLGYLPLYFEARK
ncbi:MAG TPA: hypothetical protein DFH99_07420 [Roseburia sp.]|nr:hypothetical protein [Roseburia sp.]